MRLLGRGRADAGAADLAVRNGESSPGRTHDRISVIEFGESFNKIRLGHHHRVRKTLSPRQAK
jgi:hypothetical protein